MEFRFVQRSVFLTHEFYAEFGVSSPAWMLPLNIGSLTLCVCQMPWDGHPRADKTDTHAEITDKRTQTRMTEGR